MKILKTNPVKPSSLPQAKENPYQSPLAYDEVVLPDDPEYAKETQRQKDIAGFIYLGIVGTVALLLELFTDKMNTLFEILK